LLAARRARRVTVIHPAVDSRWAPAAADDVAALRDRAGLTGPYLVLLGWRDPRKDAATALGAHLRAARVVPHHLVLVSGGSNVFAPVTFPDLPSVVRLDAVDDEQLRVLLTGAAALLYPSRYEGFGLPPLEAAACGTPAVVSDLPVLRESTQGHAAFAPPGDVGAWTEALLAALRGDLPTPPRPTRTPADTGRDLVNALRG
jgi:glycosyltransferase involved in cell wall biosynthesis